ncbi:hypothetical protein C4D60_Mb01t19970 [Musa balbisiana]|uniref:Uncharacterized protein n=1 Tax=Musa balbisiana TaxID=52838 RepID=A0A4S8JPU4_MUSBA|nr:hypothetical protein C4D60_Mb01t19970 [Musa balbisiana]
MERQSASDTSSSNKNSRDEEELPAYEETKRLCRSSVLPDAETHTNPIDRTVAHLLFKPSELFTRPVKEELPQSPVAYDPEWRRMNVQNHSNISRCAFGVPCLVVNYFNEFGFSISIVLFPDN